MHPGGRSRSPARCCRRWGTPTPRGSSTGTSSPRTSCWRRRPGLTDHVRILDFGLAKLMGSDSGLTVGMAIGTPNYMAPEQTREGTVDFRADLYAVGIVLFEMLTGKKPFDGTEVGEVFLKQLGMPRAQAARDPARGAVLGGAGGGGAAGDAEVPGRPLHRRRGDVARRWSWSPRPTPRPGPAAFVIPPGPARGDAAADDARPAVQRRAHQPGRGAARAGPAGAGGLAAPVVSPGRRRPSPPPRRSAAGGATAAVPSRRSAWLGLAVVGGAMAVALVVGLRPRPAARESRRWAERRRSKSAAAAAAPAGAPATPAAPAAPARAPARAPPRAGEPRPRPGPPPPAAPAAPPAASGRAPTPAPPPPRRASTSRRGAGARASNPSARRPGWSPRASRTARC